MLQVFFLCTYHNNYDTSILNDDVIFLACVVVSHNNVLLRMSL
jgi:hypothetical protein